MIARALLPRLAALCAASLACAPAALAATPLASTESARPQILVVVRHLPEHNRPNAAYSGGYGDALARSARRHLADRIARSHGFSLVEDWPMPLLGLDCFVMAVPARLTAEAAATEVARDAGVAWSEPMHVYRTQSGVEVKGDPMFLAQPAARAWHLSDLHRIATGRGVSVAVIDSRIESSHPDLAGQLIADEDFVPTHSSTSEAHGTGVAGIIAAKADNGLGIMGIAPGARLMGLRACWQLGGQAGTICDSLSLAKALYFAIEHNAQVINLSLSGPRDALLGRLVDAGLARGATIVAAFDRHEIDGGFPASHAGVIAVSDDATGGTPAGVYSAPGRDVPTTQPGGRWDLVNGSSYAAAHVSGLIALVREHGGRRAASARLVLASAHGGAIDACATLRGDKACDCACLPAPVARTALRH